MDLSKESVREFARLLDEYGLTKLEIADGPRRIRLSRETPHAASMKPTSARPALRAARASRPAESVPGREATSRSGEAALCEATKGPEGAEASADGTVVTAPLAGIFYRRPQPGKPPYAEVGQRVRGGDVIGLVEVMKMINEVVAPSSGVIKEFLAENEQFVEYGGPIAVMAGE